MIIYVDIDETICTNESPPNIPRDYSLSAPIERNIKIVNDLYDQGNTIVYWTARGTTTGIDWSIVTMEQFRRWGVKFHDVKFGKPNYDLFICDKSLNPRTWDEDPDTGKKRVKRIARKE